MQQIDQAHQSRDSEIAAPERIGETHGMSSRKEYHASPTRTRKGPRSFRAQARWKYMEKIRWIFAATVPCFVPRSPVGFVRTLVFWGQQDGGTPWEASADLSIFPGRASGLASPCGEEPPPSSTPRVHVEPWRYVPSHLSRNFHPPSCQSMSGMWLHPATSVLHYNQKP